MKRRERQTGTGESPLPRPPPTISRATRCKRGSSPELRAAPSCSAGRRVAAGPAPSGSGCGAHRGVRTPPAAAFADGGVRLAELPVLSAARPVCGFAEPRRRVLRGPGRPLGGCRALGGGRAGCRLLLRRLLTVQRE